MEVKKRAEIIQKWIDDYCKSAPFKLESLVIGISGGIDSFLDGVFLIENCKGNAIYAQASSFLNHANGEYENLRSFVQGQIDGIKMAKSFLKTKSLLKSENGK